MSVAEINSESKHNVVESDPQFGPSTHCVVIIEQPPLMGDEPPPQWRVSATLTLLDPVFGKEALLATLPTVIVGPLIQKRQVVAMAKYPSPVERWTFRFASDAGRATARVWLHPGNSPVTECGIFVVQHGFQV
ncbi:hypothetical protein [Polyangium spumosum]|uniref:hypothetical protein n=1 Tax=Polyangium spumosum TaxID=889282 RepID=UPI00147931AF|nr:hypothetical protein [Polyangium spumosum]